MAALHLESHLVVVAVVLALLVPVQLLELEAHQPLRVHQLPMRVAAAQEITTLATVLLAVLVVVVPVAL